MGAYPYVQAARHGGTQSSVGRVVIHCTVSPTRDYADNIAQYFRSTTRAASAHYVVDQARIYQCLPERTVGYHAPPNTGSIGVELCDPQSGSSARWRDADHEAMLRLAARLTREVAARWRVPLVRLSPAELRAGKRGICGHSDVSAAWGLTDHGDPGSGFPWAHFMELVTGDALGGPVEEDDMLGLRKGDAGERVVALQEMIKAAGQGAALGAAGSDGDYGSATSAALRRVRLSVGSTAAEDEEAGDRVDAYAYQQLHAAVARNQGRLELKKV
jgi:N-acetyl-anhydromuramyl-L-alanine amidase AmpD